MSKEPGALHDFRWETVGQYLDTVEQKIGLNVGSLIGHSAVRQYVMGERANDTETTPDDIEAMRDIVRQGMRDGALGFTTNRNPNRDLPRPRPTHRRADGATVRWVSQATRTISMPIPRGGR